MLALDITFFTHRNLSVISTWAWYPFIFSLLESLNSRLKNRVFLILIPEKGIIDFQLYLHIHFHLLGCYYPLSLYIIIARSRILLFWLTFFPFLCSFNGRFERSKILLEGSLLVKLIASRTEMSYFIVRSLAELDFSLLFEDKSHVWLVS